MGFGNAFDRAGKDLNRRVGHSREQLILPYPPKPERRGRVLGL
jgi:hypothetical protein